MTSTLDETSLECFQDSVEFYDDVLGRIRLSPLERDCVDSPEFQRLFRISQLGFVDLLFQTANHTRGMHSIGACVRAKHLVDHLNKNTPRIQRARELRARRPEPEMPRISRAERALISLAGLLHDIPHGPLSHDIEKKTHRYNGGKTKVRSHYGPYDKHDDFANNPALYLFLFDTERSILARVLRYHSPYFWRCLSLDARQESGKHLLPFVDAIKEIEWKTFADDMLPSLLFHLLVFEDIGPATASHTIDAAIEFGALAVTWGLGPNGAPDATRKTLHQTWYQPYRHDIVGNTLSADLLDYLERDGKRLGMTNTVDAKLLEYYVLVPKEVEGFGFLARCAIDLNDYRRGVIRSERINDVFRMLDFRQEIHEKAVYHRVVQSAISMAARALTRAGKNKPKPEDLYKIGDPLHATFGDERFLTDFAKTSGRGSHGLVNKLAERRVYRPLMIVPGDHVDRLLGEQQHDVSSGNQEERLRLLGAILDSAYFAPLFCLVSWCVERLLDHSLDSSEDIDSFVEREVCNGNLMQWALKCMPRRMIIWTTPYKQLYKDPAIVLRAEEFVARIDELADPNNGDKLPHSFRRRLTSGLADAESRYASMWKIYVFLSDGLFHAGGIARLVPDHPCRLDSHAHKKHLEQAQDCIIRAMQTAYEWWLAHSKNATVSLSESISPATLKEILHLYTAGRVRYQSLFAEERRSVSAVDVDAYAHIDAAGVCRDVRYRFDLPADPAKCAADLRDMFSNRATAEETLGAFLNLAKIDVKSLLHEELVDLVRHLGPRFEAFAFESLNKAARTGVTLDIKLMRQEWREFEIREANTLERDDFRELPDAQTDRSATLPTPAPQGESDRRGRLGRQRGDRSAGNLTLLGLADPPVQGGADLSDTPKATNGSDSGERSD